MGIDIFFATKTKGDKQLYSALSRDFCYLVCGPDTYGEECELSQMGKILNIDLSILSRFAPLSAPIHDLECELFEAEEDNDQEKVSALQEKIARFIEEWEHNYPFDTEAWTKIEELEPAVVEWKNKLYSNPNYYQQIHFNTEWGEYFTLKPPQNSWEGKLYLDLEKLLMLISNAKSMGEQYVTFDFG